MATKKVKLRVAPTDFFDGNVDAFKLSTQLALLYCPKHDVGWLLNLEVDKTIPLSSKSEPLKEEPIKPLQVVEIRDQHPFRVIYQDS